MIRHFAAPAAQLVATEGLKSVFPEHKREIAMAVGVTTIVVALYKDQPLAALAGLVLLLISLYQIDQDARRQVAVPLAPVPYWGQHPADVVQRWPFPHRFHNDMPTTILH